MYTSCYKLFFHKKSILRFASFSYVFAIIYNGSVIVYVDSDIFETNSICELSLFFVISGPVTDGEHETLRLYCRLRGCTSWSGAILSACYIRTVIQLSVTAHDCHHDNICISSLHRMLMTWYSDSLTICSPESRCGKTFLRL